MTYIVQEDVSNAVGDELLARLFPDGAGDIDASLVIEAIADAEADADSILGPNFVVPVVSANRILKRCCVDMTVFYGYERKTEFRIQSGANPEQARYDRARKQLGEIKSGERDMGGETPADKSSATVGEVFCSSTHFITDPTESGGATGGF